MGLFNKRDSKLLELFFKIYQEASFTVNAWRNTLDSTMREYTKEVLWVSGTVYRESS